MKSINPENVRSAEVTVIIPTMARLERYEMLKKAVYSIRNSSFNPISIIVVVNGVKYDKKVCDWIMSQIDIQLVMLPEPSAPKAILKGRELVNTEFFSTLDDDDEYLAGSTDRKLKALFSSSDSAMLVGNGFRSSGSDDFLMYENLSEARTNPLKCLMRIPWLNSGNALYRTKAIEISYFEEFHPFAEWTWLAYRLALDGKKIMVLDCPVFRCNDTEKSLSKSTEYFKSYIPLFKKMLTRLPNPEIAYLLNKKIGAAYHDASVEALQSRRLLDAWTNHLKSLTKPTGLKYLTYTRHLLFK